MRKTGEGIDGNADYVLLYGEYIVVFVSVVVEDAGSRSQKYFGDQLGGMKESTTSCLKVDLGVTTIAGFSYYFLR